VAMLKSFGSRHSMSRTCGPRDMISLVIPRLGDNRPLAPVLMREWTMTHYRSLVHYERL
jgi:hypothetical protein